MALSDEEQDDGNIYDQLKSIKAFTVDQLYMLHPDVGCPTKANEHRHNLNDTSSDSFHDQNLYQNLVDYEQLRYKLSKLKSQVKHSNRKTFDHIDKIWTFKDEAPRKIGMCQQGKIAETTFKYRQAFVNPKQLNVFDLSFDELTDLISKDYIYYSFESQMRRHLIATQLSNSYKLADDEARQTKLKSSITTLINFIKHLGDSKSDFVLQCRKWLRALIKKFLEIETIDNYRFVISQLSKGPASTADWSSDLIEYKPFGRIADLESTPQYITNCSSLLAELFNSMKSRIRKVNVALNEDMNSASSSNDQNWSLIDPRFNCSEELSSNSGNTLTEGDVIKFCLRIPIAQIFKVYVEKCLEPVEANLETGKNYELIMLKLLTIGTVIIKTYQIGLETFNSIQYGNFIEYLSSQIRKTVIVLSDQWAEFKRRLKGIDNALLMRLQVEYDNFILRSILIILELRQSGIWRHLSSIEPDDLSAIYNSSSWSTNSIRPAFAKLLEVTGLTTPTAATNQDIENEKITITPKSSNSLTYEFSIEWFKEVSEPMLWHILWQFYHNGFVSSCDYNSDNYWLEKFQEKSVVYLFVNKIRDSPPGECSYLLNSVTSMLLSRMNPDSKFVSFVATEIFNLSFKHKELKMKITKKGIRSLIRCAEKFPNLISLYLSFLNDSQIDDEVVTLINECSLLGWICNEEEFNQLAEWLIESPLTSAHNKIARLIISKLLLNSPKFRQDDQNLNDSITSRRSRKQSKIAQCFVDLKFRRRLALLLFQASVHHLPETNEYGPQSFGASVEVAFGTLFCERSSTSQTNLLELAVDTNYQQFYVWIWRILFTFRLHILNQPETDWNDVQSRSGTSRSIKNTVLVNDSFHPVPTIQDSECLSLSEGIKNQNPMASFIYLLMTDVTWQQDTIELCLDHLNMMANSSHLTPSLMSMKFLTICHLNDLTETVSKDPKCLEYFTTIINSNFDVTRLASLIMSQMQQLKQYRQLQLSQFYITIFLEVAIVIIKQLSASWFSSDEHKLEKIACLLDYIVKFNFPTQRLEIIRKFYDCSYSIQGCKVSNSWLGSIFSTNSLNVNSTKREFLTTLHILTQKFKKYSWLRWVTTECDTLRLEKIWEDIVLYLSTNEESNLDSAIKKVCPQVNSTILKSTIPIYSWIEQIFDIVESDLSHPLCPLIWYNFFLNYFTNSLNGVSVGLKLVPQDTLNKLLSRLDSLFNYHLYKQRNWTASNNPKQNSLAQLYRAYRLWLQDVSLQDAYVDMDRLREDYLVPLLKAIMESATEDACLQYIDIQGIETQNRNLSQIWSTATLLDGNILIKNMVFVENDQNDSVEILTSVEDEASDATSLIIKPYSSQPETNKILANAEEELKMQTYNFNSIGEQSIEEQISQMKKNCRIVFEESHMFGSNLQELEKMKTEILDLVQQLYTNKKCDHVRMVPCADGNECIGPARIKFEVEEATIDDRKSECIQDRQRQCEDLIEEMLLMPSSRVVRSTILIEDNIREIIKDSSKVNIVIESLLKWISEPETYSQLNGSYYTANHLLKSILDILSSTEEVNTYNSTLIEVCFQHPESVQIFSPYLSPSACSTECFLNLYKKMSSKHMELGPIATFVLLSKFDLNLWLKSNRNKELHHDIIKTTCSALSAMGKRPDDSFVLTFDLYKRHIQIELAPPDRRKPDEIALIMSEFLSSMDNQTLSPNLWVEFMVILGLEKQFTSSKKSNLNKSSTQPNRSIQAEPEFMDTMKENGCDDTSLSNLVEDIARLADCQTLFDYYALNNMMLIMSRFITEKDEMTEITIYELYKDYLDRFSTVMLSVTFMWLKTIGEQYPDNHELIWEQFMKLWCSWVFLTKNCQNVKKVDYSLFANQYVAAVGYMIHKIPDNIQLILRSVLQKLADYVGITREVVYLELTILQRCLKNLPWNNLIASAEDFVNLAKLSEQDNYNVSDLISHILMQLNIKESLTEINENNQEALPYVVERLATTIVLHSNHLKGFRLYGGFFTLIPVEKITRIARLIMPKMEFANLEHSQNNKLLVNLLRFMCIKIDINESNRSQAHITDSLDRSIIYAKFVSDYLVTLIKNHPPVVKFHKAYISAVIDNSLQDLKILLSPDLDMTKKTAIYESLLECCSSTLIDVDSRLIIAKSLIKSSLFKDRPHVVMEVFNAIGQIISDAGVLVYTIEKMVSLYLNMNGQYEHIWKNFNLKVLPSDLYLEACVEENTPLAMLVYFETLNRNHRTNNPSSSEFIMNNNKIWSSFFHWISQLSTVTYVNRSNELKSNDTKLSIAWLKLLEMFEPNLNQFIQSGRVVNNPSAQNDKSSLNEDKLDSTSLKNQPINKNINCKPLIDFMKHLITMYDSCNSSGLWSYLKFARNEQTSRSSIIALSVACFLADRSLTCLNMVTDDSDSSIMEESKSKKNTSASKNNSTALCDEITKLRKSCLSKLEAARKSKPFMEDSQFIEALIESVNQNDKVQYSEGVQLLITFVKNIHSVLDSDDCACMSKILPS